MIIDATPRPAVQPSQNWWSARSPKIRVRQSSVTSVGTTSVDPLEQGLALFHAGEVAKALPLIGRAAMAGSPKAQYLFATALFNGDGVARDWATAHALMRLAHTGGIAEAGESLAMMAELITPDQKSAAFAEPKRLVSPATAHAIAARLAALVPPAPEPPEGSLEAAVRALLASMLKERLGDLLSAAVTRQVAVATA